ncbi:MAG: extradiol dioxygenase [Nocardia sp.]|nr:extradiol dioxygenase [Nocardia sp.]
MLVPVGELGTAKHFYGAKLGLTMKFEVPEHGLALFATGKGEAPGITVRTDLRAGQGTPPAMRLWLEVPDARAAAEQLAELGVTPLAAPFEVGTGWTVEIADPRGDVIGRPTT